MQRLTFPFPFVHHHPHDWPIMKREPSGGQASHGRITLWTIRRVLWQDDEAILASNRPAYKVRRLVNAAVKVMPLQLEFWYQRMDDGRTVGQLLFLVVHRQVTGLGQFLWYNPVTTFLILVSMLDYISNANSHGYSIINFWWLQRPG